MVYLRLPIKTWWFSSQWLYSPHSSGPPVWDPFRTLQKSIGIPLVTGFFDRVSLEFPWTPYRNPIKNPLTHWEPRKKTLKTHEKNSGPSSSAFLHNVTVPSAAPLASAASPPVTLRTSLLLSSWPVQRACRATMGELTCASLYVYDIW